MVEQTIVFCGLPLQTHPPADRPLNKSAESPKAKMESAKGLGRGTGLTTPRGIMTPRGIIR